MKGGGPGGNRTHIDGFAVRYIAILPPDLGCGAYISLSPATRQGQNAVIMKGDAFFIFLNRRA